MAPDVPEADRPVAATTSEMMSTYIPCHCIESVCYFTVIRIKATFDVSPMKLFGLVSKPLHRCLGYEAMITKLELKISVCNLTESINTSPKRIYTKTTHLEKCAIWR